MDLHLQKAQAAVSYLELSLVLVIQVPRTGAIGEVSQGSNVRAVLTDSPQVQQRVARINLGGSEGSSQLQVYRKPEIVRPGGQVLPSISRSARLTVPREGLSEA